MKQSSLKSLISDILAEEWDKDVEIKSTGTHADKTIAQIKKEMESLKGKKPFNREKFSELMFALRAKQGWKKGKGATGTNESNIMKKTEIKDFIQTELSELLDKNYPDYDKRIEENTKTINVRHKTTKKKLDIPDDPDTIKKYKKMGYTLWIGSRKKNESINERTELKQIIREIIEEDLRNWFKSKWVNIGKKDKDGKHPPCGTSGDKRGYAKCVPQATASKMSDKEKESATRRKRAAQNDANRGGKESAGKNGKKPINVSTYTKKSGKKSGTGKGS